MTTKTSFDNFYASVAVPVDSDNWKRFSFSYNDVKTLTDNFNDQFITTSKNFPEVQESFVNSYTILRNLMPASCSADIRLSADDQPTITLRTAIDSAKEGELTPSRSMMAAFAVALGGGKLSAEETYTVSPTVDNLKVVSVAHNNAEESKEGKDYTFGIALAKKLPDALIDVVGEPPYEIIGTFDADAGRFVVFEDGSKLKVPVELIMYAKGVINGLFGKRSSGGVHC